MRRLMNVIGYKEVKFKTDVRGLGTTHIVAEFSGDKLLQIRSRSGQHWHRWNQLSVVQKDAMRSAAISKIKIKQPK